MKKFTGYLLTLALLSLFSCEKPSNDPVELIVGKWQWVKSQVGDTGRVITPLTYNQTEGLIFAKDGKVNELFNGIVRDTLEYSIFKEYSYLYDKNVYKLSIYASCECSADTIVYIKGKYILRVNEDSMSLGMDGTNGTNSIYTRAK
jgi:hypothetical protein